MTENPESPAEAAPPPAGVSRRDWRRVIRWARVGDWALEGVSIALVVVAAVGFGGYAGRRVLLGELAEAYLRERGVEASVEVMEVDARGFVGRVRLGAPAEPDFAAERVEVWLAAPPPPEGPYALRPTLIRVRSPRLKARWTGERLSLGALDPLLAELLERPPQDDRPGPRVLIEDGRLALLTPYGRVSVAGSGVVDDSKVERLDLAVRPARLEGRDFAADVQGAALRVRVVEDRAGVRLNLALAELQTASGRLSDARFTLAGQAPYPDLEARRLQGPVALTGGLRVAEASLGGAALRDAELGLTARGGMGGPLQRPRFEGDLDLAVRAGGLKAAEAEAVGVQGAARLTRASLSIADSTLRGRSALRASASADRVSRGASLATATAASLESSGLSFALAARDSRVAGPLRASARAASVRSGELSARGGSLGVSSPAAELGPDRLAGLIRAVLHLDSVTAPQGRASALDAELATSLAVLSTSAPVAGSASVGRLQLSAGATPLTISQAAARFDGRAGPGALALKAALRGRAALAPEQARRLARTLPILGESPAYAAAIARTLSDFQFDAPGLRVANGGVGLVAPVHVRGPDGARADLLPKGGLNLSAGGVSGGFRLAVQGVGLPQFTAEVDRVSTRGGAVQADGRLRAALDIPLAQGALVEARGRVSSGPAGFSFTAADCVRLTAARVELGENDVEALSTRMCPEAGAPVVQATAHGYRIRGRFTDAALAAPSFQVRAAEASGVLDARGDAAGLSAVEVRLAAVEVTDAAPERRFHPLALTGTAGLGQGTWRAALDVLDAPAGTRLAMAALTHAAETGRGWLDVTVTDLRFQPDGLQPHDLTPIGAGLVSKVEGEVDFTGRLAWAEGALPTSEGRIATSGLSFDGPMGRVVGLGPGLQLSSLAPLIAPSGQRVTAERIEAFTPLTAVAAELGFDAEALQLQSAQLQVAGGRLVFEPLRIPFAEPRTLSGAVRLDDVDLGALVETTGLADKVEIRAVVDGRIPFEAGPAGLRFAGGQLHSVRPGRLSIAREALTQVAAAGDPEAVAGGAGAPAAPAPTNAFQDFAYQALENLAYSDLDVSVDSRPGGRLGLVFGVKGRHDPPKPEEARIGLFDLLSGRAFQQRIPLPKDAPVNLTLDTSLNLDELLADYLELQRARTAERSAPVQP